MGYDILDSTKHPTFPALSPAGSKCKCSRKGPKIRYSDVKKLEMKPKYPHCEEKMVM